MKQKTVEIPLWERDLIVVLGGDFTSLLEIAKKNRLSTVVLEEIIYDKLTPVTARGGAYFCLIKGSGIIWFPTKRPDKGVLAHEATHIVDKILEFIGAEKEMEARAYTVEWLVNNIPKVLKTM